jgi:hypothetical protein
VIERWQGCCWPRETGQTGASLGAKQFGFLAREDVRFSLLVVVQVVGMVSLVVFNLLGVLHLMFNTMVGRVVALNLRGATVDGLPFVAFILFQ